MHKLSVVFLCFIALFSGCGDDVLQDAPSYVFPIMIVDSDVKNFKGGANAVLVDKNLKLLVINAHVVNALKGEDLFTVKISDQWYGVKIREEWINWDADLAIVELYHDDYAIEASTLPAAAPLAKLPGVGQKLFLRGHLLTIHREGVFDPYLIEGIVRDISGLEKYEPGYERLQGSLLMIMMVWGKNYVPKELLRILYGNYIVFEDNYFDKIVIVGMSGSPAITEKGEVAGILSSGNGDNHLAYIIPSFEIRNLLDKVREQIKAN